MSIWAVIIIFIAIAMVVGPIALMRPSQRDQRLTALRQAAAQKGIRVRLASLTLATGQQALALYSKISQKADESYTPWLLIQQSLEHDLHFSDHWDWADAKAQAPSHLQPALREYIESLDDSIKGIEVTKHSMGVYWKEQRLSIEQIDSLLDKLQMLLGDS